ncbi:MAG TPA: PIG-L family deacetylase [Candidatus Paceibacterota bacterium]|jgi:LmbE family N-acetylglucosaminyl deacetylase
MQNGTDKYALFVSPHPDDLELSCAISLQKFKSLGYKTLVVVVCSGEAAGDPETREAEARQGAEILGADEIVFLRYPQFKMLEDRARIKDALENIILQYVPEYVFVPWKEDTHEDHVYAAQAAVVAARGVRSVYYYPTPTSLNFTPDTLLAGDRVMLENKTRALGVHQSQINTQRVQAAYPGIASEYWKLSFGHHSRFSLNSVDREGASVEVFKVYKQELL